MQLSAFELFEDLDFTNKNVMLGLSGGINSAAALIYLSLYVEHKPKDLYLYYSHFEEHSPDTLKFVLELVEWCKPFFDNVIFEQSNHSLHKYFTEGFRGIPQPKITPCTKYLKLMPMIEFMQKYQIQIDIVGYVRSEYSRIQRQLKRSVNNKEYLIRHLSDEDCFSLVKREFGWFPDIYNLKWTDKRIGKAIEVFGHELHPNQLKIIKQYYAKGRNFRRNLIRVFKHNNCLPCKNMHQWEIFFD